MFALDPDAPDLPGASTTPSTKPPANLADVVLSGVPLADLLALRTRIDTLLPARELKDMDLSRELVLQVLVLQQLQQMVLADSSKTPANQMSQVANSVSAALVNLVKLQNEVYDSERFKQVESILVETLQTLPLEAQETFLASYEAALGGNLR